MIKIMYKIPMKRTSRRYCRSVVPLTGFIASHKPGFSPHKALCMFLEIILLFNLNPLFFIRMSDSHGADF